MKKVLHVNRSMHMHTMTSFQWCFVFFLETWICMFICSMHNNPDAENGFHFPHFVFVFLCYINFRMRFGNVRDTMGGTGELPEYSMNTMSVQCSRRGKIWIKINMISIILLFIQINEIVLEFSHHASICKIITLKHDLTC